MGTRQGSKSQSHGGDDSISTDSLSFAGLVSVQDQHPKVPTHYYHQVSKQDFDFEFSTITDLNSSANPFKITPADVLISDGKIQPFKPNRPAILDPPISLRSLLAIDHANAKMSCGQTRKYGDQRVKARNHKSKERNVTRTWFGHKVFRSFLSPCRKCQATQPGAIKGQSVP
ncbi:hypothetical protein LR48_Vigan01g057000 [Vigna angularis]|uniref:Uncharacterized protein n=2 Tax=Phaseolus angularis TaxID=3914 RepID=A0A0L9TKE3_PHAAN|nr:uncharacterized protein HKW66_Vig0008500 [Vigna angularis]KOM31015.1 hypothetical protein LR48_Vigan01g057000 [Vigna angularis]BAT73707.1 hypothetical protein VIGAN_01122100 [Vigna angularis var. angularis]